MQYHLLWPDGTYSDFANYPEAPATRQEGTWILGAPDNTVQPKAFKDTNKILEEAFLSLLPPHVGQAYLTPQVMLTVGSAKQVVTDFNNLGLYGISKQIIQGLTLPSEMDAARDQLVDLFPE